MNRPEIVYRILILALLMVLNVQLYFVATQVRSIRMEQVKNSYYSLPPHYLQQLQGMPHDRAEQVRKGLESSIKINGQVEVTGSVSVDEIDNPVEVWGSVEIER